MELIKGLTEKEALLVRKKLEEFYGINYWGADEKYFKWQYFDGPNKKLVIDENKYCGLLFQENDNILAFDMFYPDIISIDSNKFICIWDIEWNNFSSIKGLGSKLVNNLQNYCDIYLGYGCNSLSTKSFSKLGYKFVNEIERLVAILDYEILCDLMKINRESEEFKFYQKHSQITKCSKTNNFFILDKIEKLDEKYIFDHLRRFNVTIYKNLDYIEWRYFKHPYLKYDIISSDNETSSGIAILRLENILNTEFYVTRILDFFPTIGNERRLLNTILNYSYFNKSLLIDFFCVSTKLSKKFEITPFLNLAEHRKFNIPRLFQPLEIRNRKSINLVYNISNKKIDFDISDLYSTKSDGDQDVKVNLEYKTKIL